MEDKPKILHYSDIETARRRMEEKGLIIPAQDSDVARKEKARRKVLEELEKRKKKKKSPFDE